MPAVASDFFDAAERVEDLTDDLHDEIEDGASGGMNTVARELRRIVRRKDAIATRALITVLQTGPVERSPGGDVITRQVIRIPDQYKPLEYGTGAHGPYPAPDPMPPLEPILVWIVEKGIQPREYDTQYGLAKAIQESIGIEGTDSKPFARPAWYGKNGRASVKRRIEDGMSRAVRRNNLS